MRSYSLQLQIRDNRETDNAWVEYHVFCFHDETGAFFDKLQFTPHFDSDGSRRGVGAFCASVVVVVVVQLRKS